MSDQAEGVYATFTYYCPRCLTQVAVQDGREEPHRCVGPIWHALACPVHKRWLRWRLGMPFWRDDKVAKTLGVAQYGCPRCGRDHLKGQSMSDLKQAQIDHIKTHQLEFDDLMTEHRDVDEYFKEYAHVPDIYERLCSDLEIDPIHAER